MRRALVINAGMAVVGAGMLYTIVAIALYDGHYACMLPQSASPA